MLSLEDRLCTIECALTNMQRMLDDLNEESVRQGKLLDKLQKENKALRDSLENNVKNLSEEVPPPHY